MEAKIILYLQVISQGLHKLINSTDCYRLQGVSNQLYLSLSMFLGPSML